MAENNDSANLEATTRWYCHSCDSETELLRDEFVCSRCRDGFIEPIINENNSEPRLQSSETGGAARITVEHSSESDRGGPRHTRITIHRVGGGTNPFQDFLSQFIGSLMGGATQHGPVNIQFAPMMLGQNAGDYVFTAGGLDNVITMIECKQALVAEEERMKMVQSGEVLRAEHKNKNSLYEQLAKQEKLEKLLNQLDGAGPPPASKDQIDALPMTTIVQEQVDSSLQCNVCMEDFELNERVRDLPCKHVFHGDCIVPWLQLHGTCPICRKNINVRLPPTDILPD